MKGPIRYARSGDAHLAYRCFGDGPRDIVLIPGTISHLELVWELPGYEHLLKRLSTFARVIVFDKRGQGLSDRGTGFTLEQRVDDVRAVMDAAGSDRATIYGWSEGGPASLMLTASHPDRVSDLVLYGSYACQRDPSWLVTPERLAVFLDYLETHWGAGAMLRLYAPSHRDDPTFLETFSRIERAAASPGHIRELLMVAHEGDVRHLLPAIRVPTLILHRAGDKLVWVSAGRYLAEHIPGAKYVEIPGDDHLIIDRETQDVVADAIEEFMTGSHRRFAPDRVLATVVFIDIVRSTERVAALGDAGWRDLLDRFYASVSKELAAFHGREVDRAGDGVLARFDGPARAIRCACALRSVLHGLGVQARFGLHTGECEVMGDGLSGIAVHIGARILGHAEPDEVLVSSTVKDLVAGSGIGFTDRGTHVLKGVPDQRRLYAVTTPTG
jgi:pimeloyl-ACP methyl ester carboxylesterase